MRWIIASKGSVVAASVLSDDGISLGRRAPVLSRYHTINQLQQRGYKVIEQIDWNEVPDNNNNPPHSVMDITIAEPKLDYAGEDGWLVASFQAKVDQPEDLRGNTYFPSIFLGTKEDPGCDQPATLKKRGYQDFKKFLASAYGDIASLTGHIPSDMAGTANLVVRASATPSNKYPDRINWKFWRIDDPSAPLPQVFVHGRPATAIRPPARPAAPAPAQAAPPPAAAPVANGHAPQAAAVAPPAPRPAAPARPAPPPPRPAPRA